MAKKLPKHLKRLASNIDKGLDLSEKPLSNKARKKLANVMGAGFFRSEKGKIKRVK